MKILRLFGLLEVKIYWSRITCNIITPVIKNITPDKEFEDYDPRYFKRPVFQNNINNNGSVQKKIEILSV
jgi:hypothetical protein